MSFHFSQLHNLVKYGVAPVDKQIQPSRHLQSHLATLVFGDSHDTMHSQRVIGLENIDAVLAVNDGILALRHDIMRRVADEDSDVLVLEVLLEAADLLLLSI